VEASPVANYPWQCIPDAKLMNRHYTIELKSSLVTDPYLMICSNDAAMLPGSSVGIGVKGSIQTDKCAADVHTANWRFDPDPSADPRSAVGDNTGLAIINKKSGLPLQDGNRQGGSDGPHDRIAVAQRFRTERRADGQEAQVGVNEFCFLRPASGGFDAAAGKLRSGATFEVLTATKPQKVWPHYSLAWSREYEASYGTDGSIKSKSIGANAVFRLMPATWQFETGHAALDLPKADVQKQIAEIWLGAIGISLTNLGASMQGGSTQLPKLGPASAAPLAMGALVSLIQAGLATSDLLDGQGKKSDLELLYDALLPEIKNIVKEEFDQSDLREANELLDEARGHFLDAVVMYKGWCRKAGVLDDGLNVIAAHKQTESGEVLDDGQSAGFDAMSAPDREQIGRVFHEAHATFAQGLNKLRRNRNARIALGPFSTGALAHIGLLTNLSLLSYSLWHEVLVHSIRAYRDHIRATFEQIKEKRLSEFIAPGIVTVGDGYYSGSKDLRVADSRMIELFSQKLTHFRDYSFEKWRAEVERESKGAAGMARDIAKLLLPRIRAGKDGYCRHLERTLEIDFLQPRAIADKLSAYLQCIEALEAGNVDEELLRGIAATENWATVST
jgi:hypothetical protein